MNLYGIAGQSGSGKSTVSKKLSNFLTGSNVITGDRLYLETIWRHRDDAFDLFGRDAFVAEGVMNSNLIWSQPEKYAKLKRIVLPEIRKKVIDIASSNTDINLLDWVYTPIMQGDCNKTILVDAIPSLRHERILQRSKFVKTLENAQMRDSVFAPVYENFKPEYKIENNGDEVELSKQINAVLSYINR